MATLTVQKPTLAGAAFAFVAAAGGGDQFANSGREFLLITNGGGSPITVTIASEAPCDQGFDHDIVGSVTNGTSESYGPFPADRFNDINGNVQITYSGVTSVTVAVVSYL